MSGLSEGEVNELLSYTEGVLGHIYWAQQEFSVSPQKDHIATAINFNDISERRSDFLKELINTITSWVYGKEKIKSIIEDRLTVVNGDFANAYSFLTTHAFSKFRPGNPQGQFGELLLFNFLQYFFQAIPMLRKQRITTSIGHERFGSDAIHYRRDGDRNILVLGESKCYKSDYKFKQAFETSLSSIQSSFININEEMDLYLYDDFVEPEVEELAKKYKRGILENIGFELVCLVAYSETNSIEGSSEEEIKGKIVSCVESRCRALGSEVYDSVSQNVLSRINYIIFPIWEMDNLLEKFQRLVGSGG